MASLAGRLSVWTSQGTLPVSWDRDGYGNALLALDLAYNSLTGKALQLPARTHDAACERSCCAGTVPPWGINGGLQNLENFTLAGEAAASVAGPDVSPVLRRHVGACMAQATSYWATCSAALRRGTQQSLF